MDFKTEYECAVDYLKHIEDIIYKMNHSYSRTFAACALFPFTSFLFNNDFKLSSIFIELFYAYLMLLTTVAFSWFFNIERLKIKYMLILDGINSLEHRRNICIFTLIVKEKIKNKKFKNLLNGSFLVLAHFSLMSLILLTLLIAVIVLITLLK